MKFKLLAILSLFLLLISCEKGEGEGGNATIKGSVLVEEWDNNLTAKRSEHPARGEDVYIIYGDDDFYGNKVETHYDGTFEFDYLREGTYTIYIYSLDPENPSDKKLITSTVKIGSRNSTVKVPQLTIINDNGDEGAYTIEGSVLIDQYSSNYETKRYQQVAQDVDVYIQRADEAYYFDKTATNSEGYFAFQNLIEGEYTIYAFTKNPELAGDLLDVVSQTITVDAKQTVAEGSDATVFVADNLITIDNEGDKGHSTVKGIVIMQEWNGIFTVKRDEYPAQEENVYIMREGDDFYMKRVDTNYDGLFEFNGLTKGNYTVYAYSKDPTLNYDITNKLIIVSVNITITEEKQTVTTENIIVKN